MHRRMYVRLYGLFRVRQQLLRRLCGLWKQLFRRMQRRVSKFLRRGVYDHLHRQLHLRLLRHCCGGIK